MSENQTSTPRYYIHSSAVSDKKLLVWMRRGESWPSKSLEIARQLAFGFDGKGSALWDSQIIPLQDGGDVVAGKHLPDFTDDEAYAWLVTISSLDGYIEFHLPINPYFRNDV